MIHSENDFGDAGRRHRLDEACSGADDSFVLGLSADHEARDVLHEQERNPKSVAAIDEVRNLLRALGINNSAEPRLFSLAPFDQAALVRDDAEIDSIDSGVAADHLLCEALLELVDFTIVQNRSEYGVHVVRHAMVGRKYVVQTFFPVAADCRLCFRL